MKILNTIATAAVISTSLFAAVPAEAFWGGAKIPTYQQLESDSYQLSQKQMNKIYTSEGWQHFFSLPDGRAYKVKLVDCQMGKCTYYSRETDEQQKDKYVSVSQINCNSKKYRSKLVGQGGKWSQWTSIIFTGINAGGDEKAFNMFCR